MVHTGDQRGRIAAFEAAKTAVEAAERFLSSGLFTVDVFDSDGSDGLYDDSVTDIWKRVHWEATAGHINRAVHVDGQSAYVIERVGKLKAGAEITSINLESYGALMNARVGEGGRRELFRITARGRSAHGDGQAFIQVDYTVQL
ncbi:MAG: hypothetical protein ABW153_13420 [Sedimenticola sp.]